MTGSPLVCPALRTSQRLTCQVQKLLGRVLSWAGPLVTSSVVLARGFMTLAFPHSLPETPGSLRGETWQLRPGGCRVLQLRGGIRDKLLWWRKLQKSFFLIPQLSQVTLASGNKAVPKLKGFLYWRAASQKLPRLSRIAAF